MKQNQPQTIREYWSRMTGSSSSVSKKLNVLLGELEWRQQQKATFDRLSSLEKNVLVLLAQSMTDKQIANELDLSPDEAKLARQSICDKAKICNAKEAARWAIAFDLI